VGKISNLGRKFYHSYLLTRLPV